MGVLNFIKFKRALVKSGYYFPKAAADRLYERYIGHSKVIAWPDGFPMYTTVSPAIFSTQFANKLATFFLASQKNRPLPYLLNIAINDVCNAGCDFCSFFNSKEKKKEKVLSKEEIVKAVNDAIRLGVSCVNFVGGEPLMRKDFPEIIKGIDRKNAITGVFTNGFYLSENVEKLKEAGLLTVRISLDSPNEKEHDERRKVKGLFKKACEGIVKAKEAGMLTAISCCITNKSVESGDFDKLIELGKKLNVNEVFVFEELPIGGCQGKDPNYKPLDLDKAMQVAGKYNSDESYPGVVLYPYIADKFSLGCSGGVAYFYISPYGNIYPCDFHESEYGSLKNMDVPALWEILSKERDSAATGCEIVKKNVALESNVYKLKM